MWIQRTGLLRRRNVVCIAPYGPGLSPTDLVGDSLAADAQLLLNRDPGALRDCLDNVEFRFVSEALGFPYDKEVEVGFEDLPMPPGLLDGEAPTLEALEGLLEAIEPRWRLEAVSVLEEEYVEGL
ncbi:MAG: hypothetical protein ABI873_13715 [Marmoricola sp.]